MLLLPTPPRESLMPKPKKLIQELQAFQEIQFSFFQRMQDALAEEESEEIEAVVNNEIESYQSMWDYIDTL